MEPEDKIKGVLHLRDNPTYFYKWDKKEVKKLLDESEKQCLNFQIEIAGTSGQGDTAARNLFTVKDANDFLEGSFEDLVLLNRSGMMSDYGPSLHLVDKARKRMEERALERIEGIETGKVK